VVQSGSASNRGAISGAGEKETIKDGWAPADIHWKVVGAGYLIAAVGTIGAGIPLLVITDSSWMLVVASLVALLGAGLVVGRRSGRQLAIINAALTGILYYFTTALALLVGWFFQWLPEPLPGLPQGDSTFFFAWPLLQLVVSVVGAILGSSTVRRVAKGA
jgi:hypothetical protein